MPYIKAKVYSDGGHFIAIPKTAAPQRRKRITPQTVCTGQEKQTADKTEKDKSDTEALTPKESFERIYAENNGKRKAEKIKVITEEMKNHFEDESKATEFVLKNVERKERNKTVRKTRLARKIYLNEWNWFCTFTYDAEKHDETSFRKGLGDVLKRLVHRKGWRYIGVWERSPEKQRLHFHGVFYIPENGMPGKLVQREDYSFNSHKRQIIMQNTYFNDKFGRNDFNALYVKDEVAQSARYLMKYIEKSGEHLIYSKNIPTYFVSDIMDEDVVCRIGQEDRKLLLFDDFNCWEDGCLIGKISPEVIRQMPKCN